MLLIFAKVMIRIYSPAFRSTLELKERTSTPEAGPLASAPVPRAQEDPFCDLAVWHDAEHDFLYAGAHAVTASHSAEIPLETERLILRPFRPEDAVRYHSYRSLPETVRYLYRDPMTMEQSIERMPVYASLDFEKESDIFVLAIQPKNAREMAGEILFKLESIRAKQGEIGWSLHPDSIGNGYATEAATALMKYGFEHFGFHRVFARIDTENVASVKVAERLGMRREGHLIENDAFNGRWGSEYIYAVLAAEYFESID